MSVFVYVNTAKQVSDVKHLKIFATEKAVNALLQPSNAGSPQFDVVFTI